MAAFRKVADSLETLRRQVNEMAPNRSRSSDGALGDEAHRNRKSDHNPNEEGVVTAVDITNDPAHGVNARDLAEMLRHSQDPRIKYVISNRQIFSSKVSPWQWRPYNGANAHTQHVHISVMGERALYDDTRPWAIDRIARVQEPLQMPGSNRCMGITATVFGGAGDPNHSAYDNHFITDTELGVALPDRLKIRPKVRVFNSTTGASVDCNIVDVGPWNTNNPYWERGERPQAENGIDMRGRKTNLAGIDLTPAAARAIDIPGKGKVDWEFVGAPGVQPGETKMPTPTSDLGTVLQQLLALLQTTQKPQATPNDPAPVPGQLSPDDFKKITDIIKILTGGSGQLGPVNGALGETIGNMFNGKKTAIGTIGALATSLLSQAPEGAGTALGGLLTQIPVLAGLSGPALPIFLALAGWGVLGKMEKWSGQAAKK